MVGHLVEGEVGVHEPEGIFPVGLPPAAVTGRDVLHAGAVLEAGQHLQSAVSSQQSAVRTPSGGGRYLGRVLPGVSGHGVPPGGAVLPRQGELLAHLPAGLHVGQC